MPSATGGIPAASAPGTLVLDHSLRLVSWTASARAWIDALPSAWLFAAWGMLPSVIYPAATLARSVEAGHAYALLRTGNGRWVTIEAERLEGEREDEIAITLRASTPAETFRLLCRVYALTHREREVVAALVAGLDTRGVARQLSISSYTVQDHLKAVFAKTGTHNRRELLIKLGSPTIDGLPSRDAAKHL
jgi:DNA-binding CsgD family transcriptional regulator